MVRGRKRKIPLNYTPRGWKHYPSDSEINSDSDDHQASNRTYDGNILEQDEEDQPRARSNTFETNDHADNVDPINLEDTEMVSTREIFT